MNESRLRLLLVICTGTAVAALLCWSLDKLLRRSKLRDALLTGACIYIALTLDSVLLKH